MTSKTLVHNQHGLDDVEKATVAMTLANLASSGGADTVVFVSCDAVQLAMKDFEDNRRVAGYRALGDVLSTFIANGGKFWVHEESARARGFMAEDLVENAEMVDASRTVSFLNQGGRVLM
jgi:predicted peroxiredoxin